MMAELRIGCAVRGDCLALGGAFTGRVEETSLDLSDLHPDDAELLEGRVLVSVDGQVPPNWWIAAEDLELVQ